MVKGTHILRAGICLNPGHLTPSPRACFIFCSSALCGSRAPSPPRALVSGDSINLGRLTARRSYLGLVVGFQGDESWSCDYNKGKEIVRASFLQVFLQRADGWAFLKPSGKSIQ